MCTYIQLVGASASECDTIPGRQCMASCFFLLKQFEDVNIYLKSVKAYMYSDDDFNWNHGIALASVGEYKPGAVALIVSSVIFSHCIFSDNIFSSVITTSLLL